MRHNTTAGHDGPAHWEHDESFQQIMAEQLRRAPWLGLSMLAHLVVGVALATFWQHEAEPEVERVIQATPTPPPKQLPPPPPKPKEKPEPIETDEIVLVEADVVTETQSEAFSEADIPSDVQSSFFSTGTNSTLGLSGNAGGPGSRSGGRNRLGKNGRQTAIKIQNALKWLAAHQDADGKWDSDDFAKHDLEGEPCTDPGNPTHDVGVSSLALLAFLGDGSTLRSGPFRDEVKKGTRWLMTQQDPDSGLVGSRASHEYIYDHALATLALVEAAGWSRSRIVQARAELALEYLEQHRNPYGAWRYEPKSGDSDSSITGWCAFAYKSAKEFGFRMNPNGLDSALQWLDQMTDPTTGRTGYIERGGLSSRRPGDQENRFPREHGECMTAVALLCDIFVHKEDVDREQDQRRQQQTELILRKRPDWDESSGSIDHYYWYYGTYALYQVGGKPWKQWERALTKAVEATQREDGNFKGSWDAAGVWGEDGGRVYSTALLALTLEAYYRYSRLIR